MMRDRPVMAETLATKDGDANGFTGKKELLVESEMYTFAFSEAWQKLSRPNSEWLENCHLKSGKYKKKS